MTSELHLKLDSVNTYLENRHNVANYILENHYDYNELIAICFSPSNKNHAKACWILELISYKKIDWLESHLDFFFLNIKTITNQSAIRSISKVCLLLTISHFKKKEILLTENQLQQITEICFDWLIKETKVASKCYAIRALHLLGTHFDWIHPELKIILEKDYAKHTAAYKAVGREILKKIK